MNKAIASILIFVFGSMLGYAQGKPYYFQHLTPENGLSQGHILSLMQDSEGYIWIGTYYGLNRYDGYSFTHFTHSKSDTNSICQDIIYSFFEDKDGYIWVGTVYGLDRFNKKTGIFKHFKVNSGSNCLNDGYISAITQDKYGNMWIATANGGLNRIDGKTFKITYKDTDKLPTRKINDLELDKNNVLWVATDSGLWKLTFPDEKLTRVSRNNMPVNCICECETGLLWAGNKDGVLLKINPATNDITRVTFMPNEFNNRKYEISDILPDKNGKLLIATDGAGLVVFDPENQKSISLKHNLNIPSSIISNEIRSLLVDRTKTIFAGTYGKGISKTSPSNNKFFVNSIRSINQYQGDNNSFTDCAEAENGKLVIGCYNGFYVFDTLTWNYKHYLPGTTYDDNKILTIVTAPDKTIWMGTNRSIHRYTPDFKKVNSYILLNDKHNHPVYTMYFDYKGNLWLSLFISEGLFKIPESEWRDTKKKQLAYKQYRISWSDTTTLGGDHIWSIVEDKYKQLWIGCNVALSKYNEKQDNFTRYNFTGLTKTITNDQQGNLIITTRGEGFFIFNPKTNALKHFTTSNGLSQNFVFGAVPDNKNNIWLTTENGLIKFNQSAQSFRIFDTYDGLPGNRFDDRSEKLLSNGMVYMGTTNGFIYFRPESIVDDSSKVRVVLTGIKISNTPVKYSYSLAGDNIINAPVDQIKEVEIESSHRKGLQFEFAGLHFSAPLKLKYKYKLENFDKDWIETDARNRTARYTNLIEGTYYFKVKASNPDGIWNEVPYILKVIVHPPFYRSKWFISSVFLFIVFVFYLLLKLRLRAETRQSKKLTELIKERTAELTEKNAKLESIAEDLNRTNLLLQDGQLFIEQQKEELAAQRDKLMQLNITKDKLFSVVAHDLKNPFNVLMGFTHLLLTKFDKYDDSRKLKIIQTLHQSANSGYMLLENLLHWSRSQSGKVQFNPINTNTDEIINLTLPQVSIFAENKGINIETDLFNKNISIFADINMLNTVLRNLIINAIKFSEKGTTIKLETSLNENEIIFKVQDQGMGMDTETLAHLFQLDKTTSHEGTSGEKGTGLGLIICKEFVEKHKGKIWAESTEGVGSTFFFEIPLKKE